VPEIVIRDHSANRRKSASRLSPAEGDNKRPSSAPREDAYELVGRIGAHIRTVRTERSLTLEQVAAASGLTKGFLSQLERGDSSVSLATLIRLCSVLDIDLPWIFARSMKDVDPLVRRTEREATFLGGEGVLNYLLTDSSERRIEVFETQLDPGGTPSEELFSLDSGLGFMLVQQGRLKVQFENRSVLLGPGDALTYSPREPHTYRNPSETRRSIVIVMRILKSYLP
jgi:transcriptional regulator with XRE-family HTH domain